jgi:hypothetical protein
VKKPVNKAMLICAAMLTAFGFWFPRNAASFVSSDRKVTATVMETVSGGMENRRPIPGSILLRYQAGGAVYHKTVQSIDKHWQELKVGDTVGLLLGPTPDRIAPESAVRDTKSVKILSIFCLLAGAGLALLSLKKRA